MEAVSRAADFFDIGPATDIKRVWGGWGFGGFGRVWVEVALIAPEKLGNTACRGQRSVVFSKRRKTSTATELTSPLDCQSCQAEHCCKRCVAQQGASYGSGGCHQLGCPSAGSQHPPDWHHRSNSWIDSCDWLCVGRTMGFPKKVKVQGEVERPAVLRAHPQPPCGGSPHR